MSQTQVITSDWLFDGAGRAPIERGVLVIKGDEIAAVGVQGEVDVPQGPSVSHVDLGNAYITPGLIDMHSHLVLPGDDRVIETWMQNEDGVLLLQAAKNAQRALAIGVTTQADLGARNQIGFTLRRSIEMGLVQGPRLILAGRPITRTLGHCWYFNGEADGPDEIRRAARRLVGEGADIIKMMVTGGGTRGTNGYRVAYDPDEVQAAARTARLLGKKSLAHTSAAAGIRLAFDAGFDVIVHAHFYEPDGSRNFQPELARQLADSPAYVNPTLQVNLARIREMQAREKALTSAERTLLDAKLRQFDEAAEMIRLGVKMVAGSDSGWVINPFGDFVSELEALVAAGLTATGALLAGTRDAARALGCDTTVGTLEPGKKADFLAIAADPTQNIGVLRDIRSIWLGGRRVGV